MQQFFFVRSKDYYITEDQMREYRSALANMKGKRMTCRAMYMITQETIYRVSLATIKESIKALKAVIACGTGGYNKNSSTFRAVAAYEKAKCNFDFAVLQFYIKMWPSKAEEYFQEMQQQFGVSPKMESEKESESLMCKGENAIPIPISTGLDKFEPIISKEIYV